MAFDNLLVVLIALVVVFVCFLLFAIFFDPRKNQQLGGSKDQPKNKVQINEHFNRYYEHFDNAEKTKECVLKLFYVDWCGHCKNFKPIFKGELSTMINNEGIPCKLEAINCDENKEAAVQYNIQGFPTLIYQGPNNDIVEYQGERTAKSIVSFVKNMLNGNK